VKPPAYRRRFEDDLLVECIAFSRGLQPEMYVSTLPIEGLYKKLEDAMGSADMALQYIALRKRLAYIEEFARKEVHAKRSKKT